MPEPTGDGPTIMPPAPKQQGPDPLAEARAMLDAANAATAAAKAEREALTKLIEDSRKDPAPAPEGKLFDKAENGGQ